MKKVRIIASMLVFLLVACLLAPVISISAESNMSKDKGDDSRKWIMGDVDNDGEVTILDATCIQRILAEIIKNPDEGMILRGKVTEEELSIIDATMIQRFLAELPYSGKINVYVENPADNPTEKPTQAITNPSFVIETVNAKPGDKSVAVKVSVVNNPGIAAIALDINYDKSALALKSFTYNETALQGASTTSYSASVKNPCLFMVSGTKNITGDFVFATLYFDVLDTAIGECPITVTYDEDNVYNIAENNISFDIIPGAIITPGQRPTETSATAFTVTFKDYDGRVLSTQTVEKGKNATAPSPVSREGYVFVGWSVSFDNVQKDLTVTAMYLALSDSPCFVVERVSAKPGQKNVAVTVAVKNNPGIAAIALDIMFDKSNLTLIGFTYNASVLNGVSTTSYSASASTPCLYMVNGTQNISGDFTFATLYFDIPAKASGTYPISLVYDPDNVYNLAEENIPFEVINGSITVS